MLPARTRYQLLFGPYRTPRFKFGATVEDEIRGKVTIVGLTDARIPWPLGLKGKARGYIVYGALAQAVRRESAQAVMYWWGVSRPWVRACRRALGVGPQNEGTLQLRILYRRRPKASFGGHNSTGNL
jgi:hypothetical protein